MNLNVHLSHDPGTRTGRRFSTMRMSVMLAMLFSCGIVCGSDDTRSASSHGFPYDFSAPDTVFALPGRLDELSGLTVVSDSILAAVEDENGRVYHIDMRTGHVVGRFRFADDGDYEDIELLGDTLWVLDSDGDLFAMPRSGERRASRIETILTAPFDTEGLAADPVTGELWILAKEYPGKGHAGHRAVYAFDTAKRTTRPDPVLLLDLAAIASDRSAEHAVNRTLRSLARPIMDLDRFRPAALEFSPSGDTLYVVSSTDPVIVVVHRTGRILQTHDLPEFLRQPEALAMTPGGDLFVGTEAAGDRAYIALYRRRTR